MIPSLSWLASFRKLNLENKRAGNSRDDDLYYDRYSPVSRKNFSLPRLILPDFVKKSGIFCSFAEVRRQHPGAPEGSATGDGQLPLYREQRGSAHREQTLLR